MKLAGITLNALVAVLILIHPVAARAGILDFSLPQEALVIDLDAVVEKYSTDETPLKVTRSIKKRRAKTIRDINSELKKGYAQLEDIAAIDAANRTFENTYVALDGFYNLIELAVNWIGFYAYVHPDPFVREIGEKTDQYVSKFLVEMGSSRVLYAALKELKQRGGLNQQERYVLDKEMKDFESGGVALADDKRARYLAIAKELTDLSIDFSKNIREYQDSVVVSKAALEGLDEDYINSLKEVSDGQYAITLDYPDLFPYLNYGKVEDVRKELLFKFRNRAKDKNLKILTTVLKLRKERAALLGFKTHAHYIISRRMARTPARAEAFLQDLLGRIAVKARQEYDDMTKLKREITGDPKTIPYQWDKSYYSKKMVQQKYSYDPQKVKEYFATNKVISNVLKTYQTIYNLQFKKVWGKNWHADVLRYKVYKDGKRIAEFYMDLYPRPNKYKHAAAWGIRPHKIFPDGKEQLPASILVTNFPKAIGGRPSLLSIEQVETLYHEFGHVMHGVLSTSPYASLSGTSVMRDFVEAPSQIFEKWVYDVEVITRYVRHYKTGKPIPQDLIDRIIKSRNIISGLNTQRQIFYASFDLVLHQSADNVDPVKVWIEQKNKIEYFKAVEGTHAPAAFGHLMGYSAGYYGYQWSKMIAMDMYEHFRDNGGLLNSVPGIKFRDTVLAKGGTQHPDDIVKSFLGRAPKIDALLRDLGVEEE